MVISLPKLSRSEQIMDLHNGIQGKLRSAVSDAIEIGRLLSEQKDELEHGQWLPWVKEHIPFSERAVRRYIAVYEYRLKTASVADLSEAYRMIEDLEAQERSAVKAQVDAHLEAGTKPAFADRPVYDEYRKQQQADAVQARAKTMTEERRREPEAVERDPYVEALEDMINDGPDIGMSSFRDDMKQDDVVTVIRQYLDSLENDNRRLQAVNNLLKWARDEGNRLQRAIG